MNKNIGFWHALENHSYEKIASNIANSVKPNTKILEVACGPGILTEKIISKTEDKNVIYHGIDYSPKMINLCKGKIEKVTFKIADATKLPYENESFDTVIIANALHIVPNPTAILKEINRVLKDDGTFFAPNFLKPKTPRETFVLQIAKMLGYQVYNSFTYRQYLNFLEQNGFHVTEYEVLTCYRKMLCATCQKKNVLTREKSQ